jgi:uncharacterized protein YegP (UPF0339 family)
MKHALIKKCRNGQYRFVLKGKNGKVIATGEQYTRRSSCIKTLKKDFADFEIREDPAR